MDQNQENSKPKLSLKESELRILKFQARLSTFFAIATACTSLYILSSIQNGGKYNLSKKENVEAIFAKAVANNPKLNTPVFKEDIQKSAENTEDKIALACVVFSLWGGISMTLKSAKYTKALSQQPRP